MIIAIIIAYILLAPQKNKMIKLSKKGKKNIILIIIISIILYYSCFYNQMKRESFGENEDEKLLAKWAPSIVKIENDEPVY